MPALHGDLTKPEVDRGSGIGIREFPDVVARPLAYGRQ
jgi:hypothetical protein